MPLLVIGLSHKSAPLALVERGSITRERLPDALRQLVAYAHVEECVILSTCNRLEVYGQVSTVAGGAHDLKGFLAEFCRTAPDDLSGHLYSYEEDAAIRHLFRVGAGIDSIVVGEAEILGQLRRAFRAAQSEATAGKSLDPIFRRALSVGKRARTITSSARDQVSMSAAVVELVRRHIPEQDVADKRVAIVGAGDFGGTIAHALSAQGGTGAAFVNRSEGAGQELAHRYEGRFYPLDELATVISRSDVVVFATSVPDPILDRRSLQDALSMRTRVADLLILDAGIPRNVAGDVRELSGVQLLDLNDLRAVVTPGLGVDDTFKIRQIIARELTDYSAWKQETEVFPTVSALIDRANSIRELELERFLDDAPGLTPDQVRAVEKLSRRLVAKFLHRPMIETKRLARSNNGEYVTVVRELFGLDDEAVPAPGQTQESS